MGSAGVYTFTLPSGQVGVVTASATFGDLAIALGLVFLGACAILWISYQLAAMSSKRL